MCQPALVILKLQTLHWHEIVNTSRSILFKRTQIHVHSFNLRCHKDSPKFCELFQIVTELLKTLVEGFVYNSITVNFINSPDNHIHEHVDENRGPSLTTVAKYEGGTSRFVR